MGFLTPKCYWIFDEMWYSNKMDLFQYFKVGLWNYIELNLCLYFVFVYVYVFPRFTNFYYVLFCHWKVFLYTFIDIKSEKKLIVIIMSLVFLQYTKNNQTTSILRNVGKLFMNIQVVVYLLWLIFVGLCTALIWNFLLW